MQVFGHRGSPGFPRFGENTRTSFRKALDAGVAGFELDVRRCKDGTLAVIHDATVDRTTNGSGAVAQFTYNELCGFDAGHGDPIPRLSDVLDEFGRRCTVYVELKESGLSREVARLPGPFVVCAFDADDNGENSTSSWEELGAISSSVPTALLITRRKLQRIGNEAFVSAAKRFGASAIHPPRDAVTRELITIAGPADLPVRVWTINDPSEAASLRQLGVAAIFSDCPEMCLRELAR
jgi:glycerophosphoryl diester phosphodiesterase